eukprot:4249798-Amphidinium_carterae.2
MLPSSAAQDLIDMLIGMVVPGPWLGPSASSTCSLSQRSTSVCPSPSCGCPFSLEASSSGAVCLVNLYLCNQSTVVKKAACYLYFRIRWVIIR